MTSKAPTDKHQRKLYRKAHLAAWKRSGLSQRQYCKQNDLNPSTFSDWVAQYKQPDEGHFIPIEVTSPETTANTPKALRVELGNGVIVNFTQVNDIKSLLFTLRAL